MAVANIVAIEMKQTKPFGKAYVARSSSGAYAAQAADKIESEIGGESESFGGIREQQAAALIIQPSSPSATLGGAVVRAAAVFLLVCAILACWVWLRDSARASGLISYAKEDAAAMRCVRGEVSYAWDNTVAARILDRGDFVCTEWKTLKSLTRRPSHPGR